ncbi:hypothetical protein [Arthrobacter sp. 162MFSha1.1]|uniref:hypothetical protein n=1 Tax=Arthrobacter sp. 162MFSha1.1 TaxID=1151119 RepID=UPI0012DD9F35|nr:hypothetical protein [Arthrobacter sp. 162MFSha1.1]
MNPEAADAESSENRVLGPFQIPFEALPVRQFAMLHGGHWSRKDKSWIIPIKHHQAVEEELQKWQAETAT